MAEHNSTPPPLFRAAKGADDEKTVLVQFDAAELAMLEAMAADLGVTVEKLASRLVSGALKELANKMDFDPEGGADGQYH